MPVVVGAAVVLASFALYVSTAERDIVFGDTPELIAVAATFGVAHPPGYPLFTIIGWLFAHLAPGPLPFRVALLSVVCHAATVGIVYATTYVFTRRIAAAVVAGAALASSPLFWYWSGVAEVFPLNDLLSATMLLLVALWHEHPERRRLLIAGGLVGGLGMANHQTIGLLAPSVFYVMWRRRTVLLRDLRLVLAAGVAFLLGLVPYLFLIPAAAHHPDFSWGDLQGPGDLVALFLRQSYGTSALLVTGQFTGGPVHDRVVAFITAFDPLQWVLVAAGAVYAWRIKRWYVTYILIGLIIAGPLFALYSNANVTDERTRGVLDRFFLLPQAVSAPLAGLAVVAASDLSARIRVSGRVAGAAATAVALLAALVFVPLNYTQVDESSDHVARQFATDLFASMKPNAIFLGSGDPIVFSTQYLQTIDRVRRDVTLISTPLLPADWYVRELQRVKPPLTITEARYGGNGGAPVISLLDANQSRPIESVGNLPDNSPDTKYWSYSRGLLFDVLPRTETISLQKMADDNNSILATYHPAHYASLIGPYRTWDRLTLVDYSQAYYRVGQEFEHGADSIKANEPQQAADLYRQAADWYQRALAIDPTLKEARASLAGLAL
ncbi:MAG: DUF2723 domain-containing protein [Chloroflexota bacterium]|nr:DUF2723 domain-containing protein [Chloroflexota bacterium]